MQFYPSRQKQLFYAKSFVLVHIIAACFFMQPAGAQAGPPVILAFHPAAAAAGQTVTISGSGFRTNLQENIVYFGNVRASVFSAQANTLKVTVPSGAAYAPISVMVNGLTTYSSLAFTLTFPNGHLLPSDASFAPAVTLGYRGEQEIVTLADLNGDGLNDFLMTTVRSFRAYGLTVFKNTSTPGNISLGTKTDYSSTSVINGITVADFNGDGKPDVGFIDGANYGVFKNTGTGNDIALTKTWQQLDKAPISIASGDISGDGLIDIITLGNTGIRVYKNTSAGGNISFDAGTLYLYPFTVNNNYAGLSVADFDGDGKPDIAALISEGLTVAVLRNTSTANLISFAITKFILSSPSNWFGTGDVDGDNKPDMFFTYGTDKLSIFKNNGNSGFISFGIKDTAISNAIAWREMAAGDLNGDGKIDLATGGATSSGFGLRGNELFNIGVTGAASFTSFKENLGSGALGGGAAIRDIDGDGKPDVVYITMSAASETKINVLRNTGDGPATYTWTGLINNNWFTPRNWSDNLIPASETAVTIPPNTADNVNAPPNAPVIDVPATIHSIDVHQRATVIVNGSGALHVKASINIAPGAILILHGNNSLNAAGDVFNDGTIDAAAGNIIFDGTTTQTVNAGNLTAKHFTINNAAGVNVTSGAIKVLDTYKPQAGLLDLGGNVEFVLASTAKGTANVAAGEGNYISGYVTVERYIPARRAWRFITAPLNNTGPIVYNWQNSRQSIPNTGTNIYNKTRSGDPGITLNADGSNTGGEFSSMQQYNPLTNGWENITSTYDHELSSSDIPAANKAFRMFITAPYGTVAYAPSAFATTLKAFGQLQTGDQTFSFTGIPAKNLVPVGNPYASIVSLDSIHKNSTNTTGTYWVWDASRHGTTVGGYVTFSYDPVTGERDRDIETSLTAEGPFIQNGQAFFAQVKTGTGAVHINFKESFKARSATSTNAVFLTGRAATHGMYIVLEHTDSIGIDPEDEVLLKFDNAYSMGEEDDADKLLDFDENLALLVDGVYVDIERRPVPVAGDSVFMAVTSLKLNHNYGFIFKPQQLVLPGLAAYVYDRFLNTKTPVALTGETQVLFSTSGDSASLAQNRFVLFFIKAGTLASTASKLKAWQQQQGIQLQWATATEQGIQLYQVERSADGKNFIPLGAATTPRNTGKTETYSATDEQPAAGDNYYRVLVTNKNALPAYSNMVLVKKVKGNAGVLLYPNPVQKGGQLNIQLSNMQAGKYTLLLYAGDGKQVTSISVQHNGYSSVQTLTMPQQLATGNYNLVVTDEKGNEWKQRVFVIN